MSQVFLSYRHVQPDEELAEGLCAYLQARGLRVFLDRQIRVGLDWVAEIDRQLRASDAFVVLLSEESIRSDMVRQEIQTAHELRREGKMSIFPVRVGFHGDLPYDLRSYLNRIQYAFWNSGESQEELFALLHGAIAGGASLPIVPSSDPSVVSSTDPSVVAESANLRIIMETGTSRSDSPFYVLRREDDILDRRVWFYHGADWIKGKPLSATVLAVGIGTLLVVALGILGLLAQRAREGLIGVPALTYPADQLLLTGADSLWSLPWRALVSLSAPHPGLRGSALVLLVLTVALAFGNWFPWNGRRGLIALAFSASVLVTGAWLYTAAIHSSLDQPTPGHGLDCAGQFSQAWDESSAFETCTWLTNDTPKNHKRRQALGGVLGLLLLAAASAIRLGFRCKALGPRAICAQRGLLMLHLVLVLFFLRLVPPAHAYATWGVSYPAIKLRIDRPECDQTLARAISAGACCAFNVSQGGAGGVALLLWGSGCPGDAGFVSPQQVQAMGKGCLIEARSPQSISNHCL